jgi:hypothetical protein
VPQEGLYAVDAATGKLLWQRPQGGRFLAQFDGYVYLYGGAGDPAILKVEPDTGKVRTRVEAGLVAYAAASLEDQSILIATKLGEVSCLRSEKAPRLTPAMLAEALRNDRKMRLRAELEAEKAKAAARKVVDRPERKTPDWLEEEDWLASRNTAKPVGGHGLVEIAGEAKPVDEAESEEDDLDAEDELAEEEDAGGEDDDYWDDEEDDWDVDDEEAEADDEDEGDDEEADDEEEEEDDDF